MRNRDAGKAVRGEEGKVGWGARKETQTGAWGGSSGKVRSETLLNKRCVADRMNRAPQMEWSPTLCLHFAPSLGQWAPCLQFHPARPPRLAGLQALCACHPPRLPPRTKCGSREGNRGDPDLVPASLSFSAPPCSGAPRIERYRHLPAELWKCRAPGAQGRGRKSFGI